MVDLEPNTSRTYMGLCTVHVTPYPHSHIQFIKTIPSSMDFPPTCCVNSMTDNLVQAFGNQNSFFASEPRHCILQGGKLEQKETMYSIALTQDLLYTRAAQPPILQDPSTCKFTSNQSNVKPLARLEQLRNNTGIERQSHSG